MKSIVKIIVIVGCFIIIFISCKTTHVVSSKTGNELWATSCVRCHYAPTAVDFDDHEWDLIGMHMQIKAQLTEDEIEKIIEYLKDTN